MPMNFEITIDAQNPAKLAKFWEQVLSEYHIRAYDDVELRRLKALGLTPETDTSVALDGNGPTVWFQKSEVITSVRNRVHLDITSVNRSKETKRLSKLGATLQKNSDDHTVMLDPESNQFCLFGND